MLRKALILTALVIAAVLSVYIYSSARRSTFMPQPEDTAGKEASTFMPASVTKASGAQGQQTAKGTDKLKVTGPVYDLDTAAK